MPNCLQAKLPATPDGTGGPSPQPSAEEVDEGSDAEGDGRQQGEKELESGADADRFE